MFRAEIARLAVKDRKKLDLEGHDSDSMVDSLCRYIKEYVNRGWLGCSLLNLFPDITDKEIVSLQEYFGPLGYKIDKTKCIMWIYA